MAGREGAPCGACKFLRRKCVEGCVFAPYFSSEELSTSHFAAIHKIFGASNFSKLLLHIPSEEQRYDAVVSISYEAEARLQDPIHGCVSYIFSLQQQVTQLQAELTFARARLAGCSAGTSSPLYVDLKDSEPPSSYQDGSETTAFYHHNKFSCFPVYMQDYNLNPLYTDQQNNVFQGYRN